MLSMLPASISVDTHLYERETLQQELLKSVKLCQTRFGGRTELATELDSNITNLCSKLEAALSHGLKQKKNEEKKTSPLRQVRELVIGSSSETYTLWEAVKEVLTHHERDRYQTLRQVWTDRGRARAWLRSALNERCLERYLNLIIMSPTLYLYFEDWAFIRDPEIVNILPNIAAGLSSILFAISIDRLEMNNSAVPSAALIGRENEHIITEPPPIQAKRKQDKRVNNPQIISTGNDRGSIISDSSSCGNDEINITISSPPQMERSKEETIYVGVECAEEATGVLFDIDASNSDTETVGEGETNSSILRPVNNSSIGELIPVSMSEETHSSEDSISVPSFSDENEAVVKRDSDISSPKESPQDKDFRESLVKEIERLQRIVDELKETNDVHQSKMTEKYEELEEKLRLSDTKVQELNRENELLKHQLRKYVSAVQMLKEENSIEETSLYEQKLVQVAEMHGELMQLNDRLQRQIASKDTIISRLYMELEALRGPLGPSHIDITSHIISLWLPSVFLSDTPPRPHHVYQVHLRIADEEWNVFRRYTQFHTLHKLTKRQHPIVSAFQFPPKKTIGNKGVKFVEERRLKLQQYLRRLLNHIVANNPALSTRPSKDLLISIVPFFGEHNEQGKQQNNMRPRVPHSSSPHYAGL